MTKKVLSVVLALLMAVSVFSVAASAATDRNVIDDELLNDKAYYHLDYVEKENFFGGKIDLYTALGLYDNAWQNFFTGDVDINYAKTILLAVIEKVDVEYQNETFEKFVKILEAASSAADLVNKFNDLTGIVDFAETNEWATSIEVLNNVIMVANYGNRMYEKFVDGYASILSARAAGVYYSQFLNRIIDNCQNAAVVTAAQDILDDITNELSDAIQRLVTEMTDEALGDAAEFGIDAAMNLNTVTAVIKKVYKTGGNLANKLFKTESMYNYMCSLVEIYYIEKCVTPWVAYNLNARANDELLAVFSLDAEFTLREMGETLLANLATTSDKTLKSLVKGYNVDELKVRSASTIAKLTAIRPLMEKGVEAVAILTAVGDSKLLVTFNDDEVSYLAAEEAVELTKVSTGYNASVYNEALDSYIKVVILTDTNKKINATAYAFCLDVAKLYLQLDSIATGDFAQSYANAPISSELSIISQDLLAEGVPSIYVKKGDSREVRGKTYAETFADANLTFDFTFKPGASSDIVTDAEDGGLSIARFFQRIAAFFKKLFGILKG